MLKNVPKKAKQHAKKLEDALNEVDYYQSKMAPTGQEKERDDIISGTQMDSILNTLQSFTPAKKKASEGEAGPADAAPSPPIGATESAAEWPAASSKVPAADMKEESQGE